ncbi:MAG: peptidylprolyl isomerase [Deltaproteobacteria bacterium]|nr:peptidylprolyl isomerase [Deltaproteobacteria bacterium]
MLKIRKFGLLTILVLLAMLYALPSAMAQYKQDKGVIAAMVNGTVITTEMLDQEFAAIKQKVLQPGQVPNQDQLAMMKKKVLESLIDFELLYQDAVKKGYTTDNAAVNERLDKVKTQFPSEEAFKESLGKSGLTPEKLKIKMQRELTVEKYIDEGFVKKAVISEEEAKAYYNENLEAFKKPEHRKASHILIKVDPKADEAQKAEARKRIEAIQERLKKGEDFAELAKELSEGPSKQKGGDLGFFARGQMVKPFEDAIFALKPGEVSGIVTTQFGYHLIKCVEVQAPHTVPYEKVKANLTEYLKQQKARTELQAYMAKVKKEAKVETFL